MVCLPGTVSPAHSIQEQGIPAILAGESVLLAAATATGKTEAYAAPLVERLLREQWAAPGLLVISPTRALANDLFRRLEPRWPSSASPLRGAPATTPSGMTATRGPWW